MEFLNPTALYGLFALPLLLIPYLLRRKPRRYLFSSLFIFTGAGVPPTTRPWSRLRLPPAFFLQLLLLALLILALSQPVLTAHPSKIAIVLDNSASMQALEDGQARFTLAQEKAAALLSEFGAATATELYLTAPRLERFGAASFSPADAARALRGLSPVDVAEAPLDYDNALGRLAKEQHYDRIFLITDRPASGQGGTVRVISVGQPRPNLAITSFDVRHASLIDSRVSASVDVANYSSEDARVKVTLRGGGAPLATREVIVAAGAQATAGFDGLPRHAYYEALIDSRDALTLDNRRFAALPTLKKLRILGISPRPKELATLSALSGVDLDVVSPDDYAKADPTAYGLEIFHFASPAGLPRNPALFILPPNQNDLVNLGGSVASPTVTAWREGHPLTRYINFSLLRPRYARVLEPQVPGEPIVGIAEGPLVYAAQKLGVRYLVVGFDPLPYLGQENLPMSILTVNIMDWFFSFSSRRGKATGEPIELGPAQAGDQIITPAGEKIALRPGIIEFRGTVYQGLYQWLHRGETNLIAVNLQDLNESDLRQPAPIVLSGGRAATGIKSTLRPIWPYLLLAVLLLLLLEWFVNPRPGALGKRRGLRAGAPARL